MSVGDGVRASVHEAPAGTASALTMDRTSVALFVVFLLAAILYLWTAGTTMPLALSGGGADPYNQLANAFLHLHLSVGPAPAGLLGLSEPYNPSQNGAFQGLTGPLQLGIHDFSLYRGKLFLSWGPAPVVVLLVPLHLLGLQPTSSVTVSLFAIVGLGFALAALRVVLRVVGDVPVWMCVLAASTLALSSAVPFILRRPEVYEEAVSAGYCFAMAAVWLAISTLASQRVSLRRLAIMSLCIGLAAGSRPTLALIAVMLVPIYMSLRTLRPRRGLLVALVIPAGVCALLLLAYNQARFGSPLENGVTYQLGGVDQNTARFGDTSYVPPGLWFYSLSPPRAEALFPFISLTPPPVSYPGSLPGYYPQELEPTGGLLPMAPIVIFLAALPWLWRRRHASLGRLTLPLLVLAGAGMACMLFLSYTFFATTERYEVDFATLFLLGALAAWLALSKEASGRRRRLARIGGGMLATWGCVAGLAISFTGYYNLLATTHPGTWKFLEDVTSPVSRAVAMVEGHPVLGEVTAPHLPLVRFGERANVTIVSPDSRRAVLLATWEPTASAGGPVGRGRPGSALLVRGPGHAASSYRIRSGGEPTQIPVALTAGLNRLSLTPLVLEARGGRSAVEGSSQPPLLLLSVSLAREH
jgi:hypothetical protein